MPHPDPRRRPGAHARGLPRAPLTHCGHQGPPPGLRIGKAAEAKGAAEHRDELLAGLTGRVIEVGAGNGLNFRHYPTSVTEVVAIEPEPYLRERAQASAKASPVTVTVVDGTADQLPADDASFDAGVASLVLCSVDDQATALGELRRVIRPGGELRFYEHVVSDLLLAAAALARAQATRWLQTHALTWEGACPNQTAEDPFGDCYDTQIAVFSAA